MWQRVWSREQGVRRVRSRSVCESPASTSANSQPFSRPAVAESSTRTYSLPVLTLCRPRPSVRPAYGLPLRPATRPPGLPHPLVLMSSSSFDLISSSSRQSSPSFLPMDGNYKASKRILVSKTRRQQTTAKSPSPAEADPVPMPELRGGELHTLVYRQSS